MEWEAVATAVDSRQTSRLSIVSVVLYLYALMPRTELQYVPGTAVVVPIASAVQY